MQMEIHEFELFPRLTALCFTCVLVFFTSFTVFIKQLEPFCTLFEALSAFAPACHAARNPRFPHRAPV
jgi:hypothetical protein